MILFIYILHVMSLSVIFTTCMTNLEAFLVNQNMSKFDEIYTIEECADILCILLVKVKVKGKV